MRTIKSICESLNIKYDKNILINDDTEYSVGIIDDNTMLLKREINSNYNLYIIYDNLYITVSFKEKKDLELMYTYLKDNEYSKILELANMSGIHEFHIELL